MATKFDQALQKMPMKRRNFLQGTALLSASAFLAACQVAPPAAATQAEGNTGGTTNWLQADDLGDLPEATIRYWYYETPERIELGQKQVQEFMGMHPNITVQGSTAPENTDNEMLVAFIRAGTNSHIHQSVNVEDTWYITRDLLLPLEDLPGFDDVWARMNPNLNYTWTDGHVYSLSWYAGPMVMFYNGQRVREVGLDPTSPPETYSQFLEWAAALSGENQWFINLSPGEEWWRWQFTTYPFYMAATGTNQLHSTDGKSAIFNTPEAVQAYQLIQTLFTEGYNLTEVLEGNPFFSGQVAASLAGGSMLANAQRNAPEGFELIAGPVPKPDGSTVEGFPTYNFVRNFALMREQSLEGDAADQVNRAAWEFMKFLLSPEQMAADFAVSGSLPPTNDLLTNPLYSDLLTNFPAGQQYAALAADSYIYDMNTHLESESMAILTTSYVDLIFGDKSPEEALAAAEEEVNQLLAGG